MWPPAPPPAAPYGAPQPPRKSSPWGWIIGIGCLVVLLAIGGAIYGGAKLWNKSILPELQKAKVTTSSSTTTTTTETPTTTTVDEPVATPDSTPAVTAQPGKQAALKAALGGKSNWVGKINYASADWQRVKVWIGPPASEFTTAVVLQWDTQSNAYTVESTSEIPQFEPPAVQEKPRPQPAVRQTPRRNPAIPTGGKITRVDSPLDQTPVDRPPSDDGPRPSRQRALAKALAQAPESGWVAKASSHSGDWTSATVMIGPPASEFVMEFDLDWIASTHKYAIRSRRGIGE